MLERNDAASAAFILCAFPVGDACAVDAGNSGYLVRSTQAGDYGVCRFHIANCSDFGDKSKRDVAILEADLLRGFSYNIFMVINWVEAALAHSQLKQAELARQLSHRFGWREDRSVINKILKGRRMLDAKEMLDISEITGFPLPVDESTPAQNIPLVSWVSAGALARDDVADEQLGKIIVSDLPKGDWIALRVEGTSMDRISPPESIIFIDRSDKRLVSNALYVIDDGEGNATYKRYRPGPPPRFEPVSTDPAHEPIFFENDPLIIGRVRRSVINT